jgi:hypothetical protein
MVHQATVNGASHKAGGPSLARNAAGMAHDLLTMGELQMQLFLADLQSFARRGAWVLAAWLFGAALGAAALPILLAGLGLWLADMLNQSPAAGLLWVALASAILTATLIAAGYYQFRRQLGGFERSRRELHENLAVLKRLLSNYSAGDADNRSER